MQRRPPVGETPALGLAVASGGHARGGGGGGGAAARLGAGGAEILPQHRRQVSQLHSARRSRSADLRTISCHRVTTPHTSQQPAANIWSRRYDCCLRDITNIFLSIRIVIFHSCFFTHKSYLPLHCGLNYRLCQSGHMLSLSHVYPFIYIISTIYSMNMNE